MRPFEAGAFEAGIEQGSQLQGDDGRFGDLDDELSDELRRGRAEGARDRRL